MNARTIKPAGEPDVMVDSSGQVTITIPYDLRTRSGRKLVQLPGGETLTPKQLQEEPPPLQQALVRGHRWLAMLETGEVKTMRELATREGVDNSYVSRMINLTMLPPWTVAAILDDKMPDDTVLFDLAVEPPLAWFSSEN